MADQKGKEEGRVEFTPPQLWEFKGHAAKGTYFELRVWGRPSAKALRNIIRQVELYHQFVSEDEAAEPAPSPTPSTGAELGSGKQSKDQT